MKAGLVCTSRFQYNGENRVATVRREDHPLSPSRALVDKALRYTGDGDAMCLPTEAFATEYRRELIHTWRHARQAFADLAHQAYEKGSVVLCCFCKDAPFCHRIKLADALVASAQRLGVPLERGRELRCMSWGRACYGGGKSVILMSWEKPEETRDLLSRKA